MLSEKTEAAAVLETLDRDGLVILPGFIAGQTLADMQYAFEARLERLQWNNFPGYDQTERFRQGVPDILTLGQGFISTGLHPLVREVLRAYLGDTFRLAEVKGWRSLPTTRAFHGWHADSWYDQTKMSGIPREVKLAVYLTDVTTGAFRYIRGSHRKHHTRDWRPDEIAKFPPEDISVVTGKAGTAFLFDTSGLHGQSWPILQRRHALFYNYHDTSVPLQDEDIAGNRYHPLILNAAFLGGLSPEDEYILGFGDKSNFRPRYRRKSKHETLQRCQAALLKAKLFTIDIAERLAARLRR